MLVMMWAAEWPMAQFTSAGDANQVVQPVDRLPRGLRTGLVVLAVIGAGNYFGLGRWWAGVTAGKSWLR